MRLTVERLLAYDVACEMLLEAGDWPLRLPIWEGCSGNLSASAPPNRVRLCYGGTDAELAQRLADVREGLLLPLSAPLRAHLRCLLDVLEEEAGIRVQRAERRAVRKRLYGDDSWETADLVAEVEALAGPGRQRGKQMWFHCPLPGHRNGDRDASLEVDPAGRVWKCQSVHGGGGVVEWRRQTRKAGAR